MREAGIELSRASLSSILSDLFQFALNEQKNSKTKKGKRIDPKIKRLIDLPPAKATQEWVAGLAADENLYRARKLP
jgi:hypothetical protein